MLFFFKPKTSYNSVEDGEYEEELKLGGDHKSRLSRVTIESGPCSILILAMLLISSIVSTWILFFNLRLSPQHDMTTTASKGSPWVCQQPTIRREWRRLSEPEQLHYITAVKCLATKPSKLRNNGTLYDDFPWVHKELASNTHVSAPFLPWHRQYLHLYEKALKEDCYFDGSLPYWDWSLDWSKPHDAPVWDSTSGLGGDGSGPKSVGNGRCVTSGPFADINVMFYDGEVEPHCLSRGFPAEEELKELGQLIRPEAVDELMHEKEYESFAGQLEKRAHKFLSHSVRGDLSRFTGPNDPVFFLHHVNLDRLWSEWQLIDPRNRITAYSGRANNNSDAAATLTDPLDLGGLSRNLQIVDVMDTTGGQYCYKY